MTIPVRISELQCWAANATSLLYGMVQYAEFGREQRAIFGPGSSVSRTESGCPAVTGLEASVMGESDRTAKIAPVYSAGRIVSNRVEIITKK
ncbi:MAG: hypothetical protein KAR20_29660 [Candidatus Heimdallarchaeota archaeon]|nr:hypothetical protein [Candidatus Heimdallarchaeota archaeon]